MGLAVETFPEYSSQDLDWGFITQNLVTYLRPDSWGAPRLMIGERLVPSTDKTKMFYEGGTPWGPAGWEFRSVVPQEIVWSPGTGAFANLPTPPDYTIAMAFRRTSVDTEGREVFRWTYDNNNYNFLQVTNTVVRHQFWAGVFFTLSVNFASTAKKWMAVAIVHEQGVGRTMRVADCDGAKVATPATNIYLHWLDNGMKTLRIASDEKAAVNLNGTLGPWFVVSGAWTEDQFLQWAADPYAWAYELENKRNVFMPATCPHGKGKILPLVSGEAGISPTVSGAPAIAQAVDAEPMVGPSVSGKVSIGPAVSGKAKICEGSDGRY